MLVYDHEKALKRPFNYTSVSPFQIFTSLHSSFLTALKMAAGGGLGSGGGNPFWSLVWLLALIFCGWPLAGFCAGWYILILPFAVCFDGFTVSWFLQNIKRSLLFLEFCEYKLIYGLKCLTFQGFCEMLLKGVQSPQFCAEHMMKGTSLADAFK